jgi:predicted secreted protein
MAIGKSNNTKLKIGSSVYNSITSIGGLSLSADTIDVTVLDSANGYREFIQGFRDGGEVQISGFFDPADTNGQMATLTNLNDGSVDSYSIEFTSLAYKWTFDGIVTGFSTSSAVGDAIGWETTIKVSGKPSLAAIT